MFTATQPIRDIVAELSSATFILARFEIDSSRHADDNLEQACSATQLSVDQVLEKLQEAALNVGGAGQPDPSQFSLTRLIQYIVRVHHRYLREQLPQLIARAQEAAITAAGPSDTWRKVARLLDELRNAMGRHFEKEEQILFPYIAQMDDDPRLAYLPVGGRCTSMSETVFLATQEHESVDHGLQEIEALLSGMPESADCGDFVAGFGALKRDIEAHVHLEGYCLFPRAIRAEQEAKQGR
jgi:regulator of cell morphogenesis and NO signaling